MKSFFFCSKMNIHPEAAPESVKLTKQAIADAFQRNEELDLEISNARKKQQMVSDKGLKKDVEFYRGQIEKQLRRCHQLEIFNDGLRKKIQNSTKRRADQRRMVGGTFAAKENERLMRRQTQILQDKLVLVRVNLV